MKHIVHFPAVGLAPARGHFKKFLLLALAAGSALLVLPSAQADMISFENIGGGPLGDQFTIPLANYTVTAVDNLGPEAGSLAGAVVNGSAPFCFGFDCPTWGKGSYYASLNDSSMSLTNNASHAFGLKSFDASMVADFTVPNGSTGLLRVTGTLADHTTAYEDFSLAGRGSSGYAFQHFDADRTFGAEQFVALSFSSFICTAGQPCSAVAANFGQFAVDNIDTGALAAAVPEPSSWMMMGMGLLGIAAAARRKHHRFIGRTA
jgi:hypothetical protein